MRPESNNAGFELPTPAEFQQNLARELPLTEAEQAQVLLLARQQKYTAAFRRWYAHQTLLAQQPQPFTARQLWDWFHREAWRRLDRPFLVDENNEAVLQALCLYFAEDPRFEALEKGYSLEKGLLLRGPVGCGKTTLMSLFAGNPRLPYQLVPTAQIVAEYKHKDHGGPVALKPYQHLFAIPQGRGAQFNYRTHGGHCFDDLGVEDTRPRHMGNEQNCLEDILSARDSAVLAGQLPRCATHLTTNLRFGDYQPPAGADGVLPPPVLGLESRYGPRIRSRIRGLMNTLTFPEKAPDRRA